MCKVLQWLRLMLAYADCVCMASVAQLTPRLGSNSIELPWRADYLGTPSVGLS